MVSEKRKIAFDIWLHLDACASQARRNGALAYAHEAFARSQVAWCIWQQAQQEEYRREQLSWLQTGRPYESNVQI